MDFFLMKNRKGLVAGRELKQLPPAPVKDVAAAADVPSFPPGQENDLVGIRDELRFPIHLVRGNFDAVRQAVGERMAGIDDPELFLLSLRHGAETPPQPCIVIDTQHFLPGL